MRETLVTHLPGDETMLSSRASIPAIDVLERRPVADPIIWPVLEVWITGHANGYLGDPQPTPQQRVWHRYAPCCFHDLFSATDQELAGMGLAIIGNLCKVVASKTISTQCDARIELVRGASATPMALPWPGMPDARAVPLDLTELPFEFEMFLHNEDGQFKKRVDRLSLMRRIEDLWVPHMKTLLETKL